MYILGWSSQDLDRWLTMVMLVNPLMIGLMGVTNYLRSPSQHQCCLDFAKSTQRSNWFALLYTYLDPPRMSNFSTLDLFLVGKGLKFQTLAGFRYIYIYIHTYNRYIYMYTFRYICLFRYTFKEQRRTSNEWCSKM